MRTTLCLLVGLIALPSAGCKSLLKKRDTGEDAAASAVVAPPPAPVAATAPAPTAAQTPVEDIPTPEDFEDQAFQKITAANFSTELARLKKEIEAP